jgi:biopolymer transport protein ExbD
VRYGIYFIDVLACLLFGVTLALVGADFQRESTVPIDLPKLNPSTEAGADLTRTPITLRSENGATEYYLEEQRVSFEELAERLRGAPPMGVVLRSEDSELTRVIALAHETGVRDIQIAYQVVQVNEGSP